MITVDKALVQWETDRVVTITERGTANEVHFYNGKCERALIVAINDDDTAPIPNILLQDTLSIHAWLVCDDGCCNKCSGHAVFEIEARVKPDEYIYTETQVKTFNSLIKEVNDIVSDLEEKVDSQADNITVLSGKVDKQSMDVAQIKKDIVNLAPIIRDTKIGKIISIYDRLDKPFKAFKLYGNCRQNGVPSIDAPQRILGSWAEIVIAGKNLINLREFEMTTTSYTNNTNYTSASSELYEFLKAHTGETVVYSCKITHSDDIDASAPAKPGTIIFFNAGFVSEIIRLIPNQSFEVPELPENYSHVMIYGAKNNVEVTISNLQLEFNTVATPYEACKEQVLDIMDDGSPFNLYGIPVSNGGNYTDENGQQWICDEVDVIEKVMIQRIGYIYSYDGEEITTPYISTTGELSDGAAVIYVLDEPIIKPFTEDDIAKCEALRMSAPNITFNGRHWGNNAYIEVTYDADTKMYIDNKFTELKHAILSMGGYI